MYQYVQTFLKYYHHNIHIIHSMQYISKALRNCFFKSIHKNRDWTIFKSTMAQFETRQGVNPIMYGPDLSLNQSLRKKGRAVYQMIKPLFCLQGLREVRNIHNIGFWERAITFYSKNHPDSQFRSNENIKFRKPELIL